MCGVMQTQEGHSFTVCGHATRNRVAKRTMTSFNRSLGGGSMIVPPFSGGVIHAELNPIQRSLKMAQSRFGRCAPERLRLTMACDEHSSPPLHVTPAGWHEHLTIPVCARMKPRNLSQRKEGSRKLSRTQSNTRKKRSRMARRTTKMAHQGNRKTRMGRRTRRKPTTARFLVMKLVWQKHHGNAPRERAIWIRPKNSRCEVAVPTPEGRHKFVKYTVSVSSSFPDT